MAQRQMEERVEGMEKEILGLKETMLELKKTMDRMADEMRENTSYKRREESSTSNASAMKLKGKSEESDVETKMNTPAGLEPCLQVEVVSRRPQTLEACMKEAQLVTDQNLALKLARAKLGIPEPKGGETSNIKASGGNEQGVQRKTKFQMKQITIPVKGNYQKEEGTEEEEIIEGMEEEIVELKNLKVPEGTEIELKTIMGFATKGTVKLKGMGTTFGVTIGDGTYYEGKRQCKRVELRLKELTIIVDLLAVELDRVDVILSMQWLETTGTMRMRITLKRNTEEDLPMIRFLLRQYADIFETPKELPPKRGVDHHIMTLLSVFKGSRRTKAQWSSGA
ncbi:peroxidase 64 [Cucumis melo var. makuwa]|uniref:Peroxidase 64 n=1 Tax=Cucumis melo var. makuwa TaxID=1194695 RepID=A0A5A7TZQ5_CUCMM|nr:peroxidase 64 [Cucumis melo var. makuwa]TYK28305.1 peroxidase 64 [Cucumis melo var. makuwa]